MTNFTERLKAFTSGRNPKGCSAREMKSLTAQGEAVLPDSYCQFMEVAGNRVDDFLQGSEFTLRDLDGVREAADELLIQADLKPLPENAFVFSMHQGYQFYFFYNGEVFYFIEGADYVEQRYDSFEQFFDAEVADIEWQ